MPNQERRLKKVVFENQKTGLGYGIWSACTFFRGDHFLGGNTIGNCIFLCFLGISKKTLKHGQYLYIFGRPQKMRTRKFEKLVFLQK